MADVTPRDPAKDALITPQNAVIAFIDYQPEQYAGVRIFQHDERIEAVINAMNQPANFYTSFRNTSNGGRMVTPLLLINPMNTVSAVTLSMSNNVERISG